MVFLIPEFFVFQSDIFSSDDDEDDDEDGESESIQMNHPTSAIEKQLGTKRDDSRRRAAHTAAEQKRRNAIRVISRKRSAFYFCLLERIRCLTKPCSK